PPDGRKCLQELMKPRPLGCAQRRPHPPGAPWPLAVRCRGTDTRPRPRPRLVIRHILRRVSSPPQEQGGGMDHPKSPGLKSGARWGASCLARAMEARPSGGLWVLSTGARFPGLAGRRMAVVMGALISDVLGDGW